MLNQRSHTRAIAAMLSAPPPLTPGERRAHWHRVHDDADFAPPFDLGPADADALIEAGERANFAARANLIGVAAGGIVACAMALSGLWHA